MIQLNQIEGIHAGKKAIVFGCGTSVRLFDKYKNNRPKDLIILGVNDIGEYIIPDYNCIFDKKLIDYENKRTDDWRLGVRHEDEKIRQS